MQKRVLGIVLATLGFGGMFLAGYIFATGSGGRGHLVEVTSYMIVGAVCFFAGLNYIYEARTNFSIDNVQVTPDLEEIPPIQQQWRTIQVSNPVTANNVQ